MSGAPLVVFRADASPSIGTGHVARSSTLASELIDRGWDAVLAARELPAGLRERVVAAGIGVVDLAPAIRLEDEPAAIANAVAVADRSGPAVVVTDHYGITAHWQDSVNWARLVAAVDDLAAEPQSVGLLVNQNLGATRERYAGLVPGGTTLLLGPNYALVRPEFAQLREKSLTTRGVGRGPDRRVLVLMGGADERDATRAAAEAAESLGAVVDVVVGAAYPHVDGLRAWAADRPRVTVHVNTDAVAQLMAVADVCLGAAGAASWERCTLGLPTILVTLAQNQVEVASLLDDAGAAILLGPLEDVTAMQFAAALRALLESPRKLESMSRAAAEIADGLGTPRVADALEDEVAR